jgi:uncharacterized membrane-anchored protein YhcB (DUF1043 family)
MKNNCQGPCLMHCYKEEKFIYLIVGFILGIVIYEIINRIINQMAEIDKKNKPKPPSMD